MRFRTSLKVYLLVISSLVILPTLESTANNCYSLTSDSSNLEGGIFCPDVSIQLSCEARNVSGDIVRWFYSNLTESSNSYKDLTAYSAENAPPLPHKINAIESNAIAGVEVYLTGFRRDSSNSYSYNSTLYINTSLYRSQEYLGFTCGTYFIKSERIDIQFKIQTANNSCYSLTSDSSNLEGRIFCPDVSIQLFCEATHVSGDIVRWFYSNLTESNNSYKDLTAYSPDNAPSLPHKINAIESNAIAGVEVYLTGFRRFSSNSYSYNSTLYINTSLYRSQEYLGFTCGTHFIKSERIDIQYKIQTDPITPLVKGLTTTYANETLHSIGAHWQQMNLNVSQNITCSDVYVVELYYEISNSGGLLDYHIIPYNHCNGIECNTSFTIDTVLDSSTVLRVKVLSTDSSLRYNSTIVTFSGAAPYLVSRVINYNIETPAKNCSPVSVSCFSFIEDIRNCTFQYRTRNSDEEFATEDIPINKTVTMAEVKMFTHYEFMLIAETENVIISFKVFGEFNSHPSLASLTSANEVLLAVEVILFFIGFLLLLVNGFLIKSIHYTVTQMALAITRAIIVKQSVLMAVVIAMLIFVGVIVSTQSEEDLCDSEWISLRNIMITSIFVLTLYLILVMTVLLSVLLYIKYKGEIYNLYYSKKKSSSTATQQIRSREEEKPQQRSQEMQHIMPHTEYFGRLPAEDVTQEDGLYDLPDDNISIRSHISQAQTQMDCHLYDDMDDLEKNRPSYTVIDKSKVAQTTIYNMPLDNEEDAQHREEKIYESIKEENPYPRDYTSSQKWLYGSSDGH